MVKRVRADLGISPSGELQDRRFSLERSAGRDHGILVS